MKSKLSAFLIAIAAILLPMQFMSGCKTQKPCNDVQYVDPMTNSMQSTAFNDEHYVWENFYFSTNQVKSANQK